MKPRYVKPEEGAIFLGNIRVYDAYFLPGRRPAIILVGEGSERYHAYCASLEKGQYLYILHRALALAKDLNLYRSHLEEILLPHNSKNLYVVIGSCGFGIDERDWLVRAFRDKGSAETFAKACEGVASNWKDDHGDPPYNWSLLDPNMKSDDGGTHYSVEPLPISLRSDELGTDNEVCPICRQQLYVTSRGKVCEQGHEVF